ncbi:hypothetical protein SEA_MOLLYMUR_82 [Gordonia phage Mollymur]|uniref:Uncharacterized protein n=1 Tax=Gordonia phage Mollymur TaxID=2590895 RepID=A0A4Y6EBJ2_9CAUD|nr:hypothetical protein PQB84_gp044 [Gordonia phage Mollymur]QDF15442.1 hypothetical protein SEA_MOLLYMUR_82 [Gordonia phage Mollymur]
MTLAHAELLDEVEARIERQVAAMTDADVRRRYLSVCRAMSKMLGVAVGNMASGNAAAQVIHNAVIAIQQEQARLFDEPDAWERMERP